MIMRDKDFHEAVEFTANHCGFEQQTEVLIEDCAELIQKAQQMKRYHYNGLDRVEFISKLADVTIVTNQIQSLLDDDLKALFKQFVKNKLNRQLQRIANEDKGE